MNILDCKNMMVGGIAAQKDVRLEMPVGKYQKTENILILFVRGGVAHVEIDFTLYELKEDSLITIVPKSTIRCIDISDDFRGSFISYDQAFGIEATPRPEPAYIDFIRQYPLGTLPKHRVEPTHAGIGNITYFLYDNGGKHRIQIAKNIVQGMFLELYDVIKERFLANKPKAVDRQHELFMKFIHLVYQYGDKQREVAFYADQLCITTRYLASIVRNVGHETAKEIIDRHCVQEIKALLRTTNESIQSISIQLDFPDQSFFTRYFKKLTGMTPKEFRVKEE